jgi:signal transduction histidine kinase
MRNGENSGGIGRNGHGGQPLPTRLEDVRRSERTMVIVRGLATVFALVQVLSYRQYSYPEGLKGAALGLVGALAVANLAIWLASRRTRDPRAAYRLSYIAMVADILLASGFVWIYTFDPDTALWAVLFIMPLEGAIRFALPGALGAWAAVTLIYSAREIWGSRAYDNPLLWESISFRMGIGLLIALVAGMMARDLLRQRARVAEALEDVSRIDRLRSGLVAMLAHDVRNPLTGIRGTLLTLIRHGSRLPEHERDAMIRGADEHAARLERLATDLLDLARLEEGRMDLRLEDIPLREAIENGLAAAAAGERYEVRIGDPMTVRADRGRLEQIVVNLATNALRYGKPPFIVDASENGGGAVSIRFRDEGPGLKPAGKGALFEAFQTETRGSSVGLGLAIVRALTEAQGGRVTFEPNEPRGACFRITLPAGGSTAAG